MNKGQVNFHRTVLNVPLNVTPLKFKDWLKDEATQIQKNCNASSFAIIKIFLPLRVRLAFPRAELDQFLQDLPNSFPNIHLIDVVQVEQSFSDEQMAFIREREKRSIEELSNSVNEFLRAQSGKK